jgi:hypothetical protein
MTGAAAARDGCKRRAGRGTASDLRSASPGLRDGLATSSCPALDAT